MGGRRLGRAGLVSAGTLAFLFGAASPAPAGEGLSGLGGVVDDTASKVREDTAKNLREQADRAGKALGHPTKELRNQTTRTVDQTVDKVRNLVAPNDSDSREQPTSDPDDTQARQRSGTDREPTAAGGSDEPATTRQKPAGHRGSSKNARAVPADRSSVPALDPVTAAPLGAMRLLSSAQRAGPPPGQPPLSLPRTAPQPKPQVAPSSAPQVPAPLEARAQPRQASVAAGLALPEPPVTAAAAAFAAVTMGHVAVFWRRRHPR